MKHPYHFLFLASFWLAACGSIKPEPPDKSNLLLSQKPIPKVVSVLDLPLEIDLNPYLKLADAAVDKTFQGSENPCQGLRYSYKMNRGTISANGKGSNVIGLGMDLTYAVKGEYCALCFGNSCSVPTVGLSLGYGEPMKRARVGMESSVSILPNYQIKTQSKLTELTAVDPIKVAFGIDVTNMVLNQVKPYLNDAMKMVDAEVAKIDVKAMIEPAFKGLQEGISLNGMGFLYLQPAQLSISPLSFQKNKLKMSVGINAAPEIRSSQQVSKPTKLPNLKEYKKADGFKVYTDIRMQYDSLASQIMLFVKDQKFESGGQYILIKALKLFAVEERLGVEVDFEGSKKGRLYLTGLPVYDSLSQRIRVDDLQFDLKTKNILLKSAKWLLNDKIRKEMQKAMNVDVSGYLKDAKKQLNDALNAQYDYGVTLSGNINKLNITDYQMRAEELWVRVFLAGSLKVNL
jgi:hypothetical protein